MTLEEALMHFELEKGATFFQLEEKYSGLKQQYELLMANAPNPTVLRVYKKNLDDLDAAFSFASSALKEQMTEELAFSIIGLPLAATPSEIDAQYKLVKFELDAGMKIPDKTVQAECRYELQRLEEAITLINNLLAERKKKQQFTQLIRQGDQQLAEHKFELAATSYTQAGTVLPDALVQQKLDALALIKVRVEKEEAERKQREEVERIRKEKEEQERKEREERERIKREEEEKKRKAQEEKERKEREEQEKKKREEEEARKKLEELKRAEQAKIAEEEKQKRVLEAAATKQTKPAKDEVKPLQATKNKEVKAVVSANENKPAGKTNTKAMVMAAVVLVVAIFAGYIFYSTHLATVVFIADNNAELVLGGGTVLELTANEKLEAQIAPGEYEYTAEAKESGEQVSGIFKVESRFGEVQVKINLATTSATTETVKATENTDTPDSSIPVADNKDVKQGGKETKTEENIKTGKEVKNDNTTNTVVSTTPVTTPLQADTKSPADNKVESGADEVEFNIWWMSLDATWKSALLKAARVDDISSIESKTKILGIQKLDISNQKITTLEPLKELTKLKELTCLENKIENLEPLRRLKNLEYLWLAKNKVSNVEPLSGLTRLKTLNLQKNNLSSIEALRNLTNLETLFINYNNISSLKPLYGLSKIKSIAPKFNAYGENEIDALKEKLPGATFSTY